MKTVMTGSAMLVLAGVLVMTPAPAAAQGEETGSGRGATTIIQESGGPVPRTADGKPDLAGYWQPRSNGGFPTNNIEQHPPSFLRGGGNSIISDPPDGKLPYQQWALHERDVRRRPENSYDDPEGHCFLSGVPRMMDFNHQIIQTPGTIVLLFEYIHGTRFIHLNGRKHVSAKIRMWNGDSVGRWEGDTLVVETTNNNGKTWLDLSGNYTSDAAVVTERFTMVDANTIEWEATVNDPKVYTRPWTEKMRLLRQQLGTYGLLEEACHEDNQDLAHTRAIQEAAKNKRK